MEADADARAYEALSKHPRLGVLATLTRSLMKTAAEARSGDVPAGRVADLATELYRTDQYSDYFLFHGLATELTEAYAERLHAGIRKDLGIAARDARELRQLFNQGYQGSRYSFGYPACPDLEGNATLLELLGGAGIGVTISEQFQMEPEYSTSALVAWHPQARYFAI